MQYAIFTLIIKKLTKKLYIYINYKTLNTLIIKNCNILLLIKKILQKLYKIRFYNKLNIIVIFNKIQIYFKNKYKIVFIICYNLLKYIVIFLNYTILLRV